VRKKLEAETGKQYIQTELVGYRFVPEGWTAMKNEAETRCATADIIFMRYPAPEDRRRSPGSGAP